MPYYMCWQQLLVVWIHYCVSMGCGFHFYKVNSNIHCCVSQDKHLYQIGECGFPHLHPTTSGDHQAPKPLWKTIYPEQWTSPSVCVIRLTWEHLQLNNARPPFLKKPWETQMYTSDQESVI